MALFGRRKPDADNTAGWTPVSIHIIEARRPLERDGGGGGVLNELIDLAVDQAGTPYSFVLRVSPPGAAAYQVEHEERVPARVTRGPIGQGAIKIPDDIELPGWMNPSDPTKVAIDWSGFRSDPESKAAVEDAGVAEADRNYATQLVPKMKPKQLEALRASAAASAAMLAPMVRAGQISREDFDREALMNLRRTLLTQEQYDAAVAVIEAP
ncbi:MAG: hypothetical protein ABI566_03720 [Pseudolysinimonas sp.]